MTTFPTLFSRTSTGAVQTWKIFVNEDKYWTEYGQQLGKQCGTLPTTCLPTNVGRANERNATQQALFEAQAVWDKKKKSEGYFEHISEIDNQLFVAPMLAKKFLDRKGKVPYPCISQCKYNGGRCIATKDGMFSRKGEKYLNAKHIEESLVEFFNMFPDAVLDGELMGDGMKETLNETMKLIRRTVNITEDDIIRSEKLVKYHIYDCYNCYGVEQKNGYVIRSSAIKKIVHNNPYCREVESRICKNEAEVFAHFNELVSNNEEGSIVRLLNKPYENKRSSALLKMKPCDDDEFTITNIQEGSGNWSGKAKIISLLDKNGKAFDATFKGNMPDAEKCLNEKDKWIGKVVTINYFGFTGLGTPNYAQFDYKNCLKS